MTNNEILSLNNNKLFRLILHRAKDNMFTELDGETVILDIASGTYSGLDSTGTFIWKQLERPATIGALRDAILETHDVREEQCVADLLEFLRYLADNGLIVIDGAEGV